MRVSLFIPCYNEEKSIRKSVESWLSQSRLADEIIVVNDSSTDGTLAILEEYADKIKIVTTPRNMGNKSHAQEYGLQFVTGDILVTSDGDTVLDYRFIEEISSCFDDPEVAAAGGYVRSMRYNWLTLCRAFDYTIGQNLHKLAQSYLDFMLVIPGAAGAFRASVFREYLKFDHDTITEDLDSTYKLHKSRFKIAYNRKAIVLTQDPATIRSYINQMRRWYGGGWQNLKKHFDIVTRPVQALELSLTYIEGLVFSVLLFLMPFLNMYFELFFVASYFLVAVILALLVAIKEKRADMLWVPIPYLIIIFVNSYVFLEQFLMEIIFKQKNLVWFKPERVRI